MMPNQIRAVLIPVGQPPRIIEAEPAALWTLLGGVPIHFASLALSRRGRSFAAVWCSNVAVGAPNRVVFAPMFRYLEVVTEIYGPILITAAKEHDEAFALNHDEVTTCILVASRWPTLPNQPSGPPNRNGQPPGRSRRCKLTP
jgi:hypothetical protein